MALSPLAGYAPHAPRPAPFAQSGMTPTIGLNADLANLASHDPSLTAKIVRKRQQAADRAATMFSPRLARIGCDVAGLNAQVAAKKAAIAEEASGEGFEVNKIKLTEAIQNLNEAEQQKRERARKQECVEYSMKNLRKEQRREYYLFNDPDELKKDRVPGTDSSYSSCQYFESEKTMSPEYIKRNQQNTKDWLLAQMAEKQLRDAACAKADKQFEQWESDANQVRALCEQAEIAKKSDDVRFHAEENLRLAAEKTRKRQAAVERLAAEEKRHVEQEMAARLERERHDYSLSRTGRKIDVKRCSLEEAQKVLNENAELVLYKKLCNDGEAALDTLHMKNGAISEKIMQLADDRASSLRLSKRQQMDEENQRSARAKRAADELERKEYKSVNPLW